MATTEPTDIKKDEKPEGTDAAASDPSTTQPLSASTPEPSSVNNTATSDSPTSELPSPLPPTPVTSESSALPSSPIEKTTANETLATPPPPPPPSEDKVKANESSASPSPPPVTPVEKTAASGPSTTTPSSPVTAKTDTIESPTEKAPAPKPPTSQPTSLASTIIKASVLAQPGFTEQIVNKETINIQPDSTQKTISKETTINQDGVTEKVTVVATSTTRPGAVETNVIKETLISPSIAAEIKASTEPLIPKTTAPQKTVEVKTPVGDASLTVKPATTNQRITGLRGKIPNGGLFGSKTTLISFIILAIIPLAQLYFGVRYNGQCRINWRIPQYLVVAGAVGLVAIALQIVQNLLALYIEKKANNENIETPGIIGCLVATCGACGICMTTVILNLFLFAWGIAGCVWIFGAYNKVQYINPRHHTYCYETLYRAAFWLVIIAMAYYVYGSCCSGARGREQINMNKQTNTRKAAAQA